MGILAFFSGWELLNLRGFSIFQPSFQLPFAFAPLLAAVDWLTQTMGKRESTSFVRLVSGTLLGLAGTDAVVLLITERWSYLAIAIGVFAIYCALILATLWVSGSWRRVVEEHFPGLETVPND